MKQKLFNAIAVAWMLCSTLYIVHLHQSLTNHQTPADSVATEKQFSKTALYTLDEDGNWTLQQDISNCTHADDDRSKKVWTKTTFENGVRVYHQNLQYNHEKSH